MVTDKLDASQHVRLSRLPKFEALLNGYLNKKIFADVRGRNSYFASQFVLRGLHLVEFIESGRAPILTVDEIFSCRQRRTC